MVINDNFHAAWLCSSWKSANVCWLSWQGCILHLVQFTLAKQYILKIQFWNGYYPLHSHEQVENMMVSSGRRSCCRGNYPREIGFKSGRKKKVFFLWRLLSTFFNSYSWALYYHSSKSHQSKITWLVPWEPKSSRLQIKQIDQTLTCGHHCWVLGQLSCPLGNRSINATLIFGWPWASSAVAIYFDFHGKSGHVQFHHLF